MTSLSRAIPSSFKRAAVQSIPWAQRTITSISGRTISYRTPINKSLFPSKNQLTPVGAIHRSITMTSYTPPTEQDTIALLQAIEAKFPHKTLGSDKWYLVALSALVSVEPEQIATLYTYLINKPEYATSEARKALIRRIREALVKGIAIHGVCKPIEGIISIVQVERPEDKDYSCSRENWVTGPENLARGENWLNQIYKGNLSASTDNFLAHRDFDFISRHITYGFYLSDHTILGPIETELVVLSGIMIQNLPKETAWHFRGIRRVGVSQEDVESVHQCVELVAKYGRVSLHKVPRMADVEHEV